MRASLFCNDFAGLAGSRGSTAGRKIDYEAAWNDVDLVKAETPAQVITAREMIEEYAAWLEFKLCFQGYEDEIRSLPGKYAPPTGRLLLALWEGRPAGVIALRPLEEPGVCEMKRLYVRPEFRGHQIGRILAERVIAEAAEIGYSRMRLDTILGKMDSAIAMYRTLGFAEISPYYKTPVGETLFMELALNPSVKSNSGARAGG